MELFDRLQDELLIHIISFLPTKYAVLTSALSRRWKLLWCYANKSLVFAPSLKRLRIRFGPSEASNKFLINAPILEDLVVVDHSFQRYVIKSKCLVNAKIDIGFPDVRNYQRYQILIPRVRKLLCRISHVMFLNLKAHTMDALSICCNSMHRTLPQFPALCHLKLCFLNYSSWDVIPKLLECAPNLQVLLISKDFKGSDAPFRRDSVWIQPSSIPVCLLSSLRQVQVSDCESQQVEFDLISYFLKHGVVLSSFVVDLLPAYSRDDLRFREKLMLIPRASKTCELQASVYPHCSERSSSPDEEENRHLAKLQQLRMPPEKMCFEDLRVSTDYFSDDHLIIRTKYYKVYRGKLYQSSPFDPPVTDVVVKRWIIPAKRPYSKHKEDAMYSFREELKLLKHPNFKYHPYFMSLLGYCCEDYNERLGVVYNFKPLDCLKNLIPNDSFKWLQRIKVALVLVCISEYMHKQDGYIPSVSPRLCPSSVLLDEDYMPVLFNFNRRQRYTRENDQYDDVYKYGLTLLSLISKRVHRCPIGRDHTCECRTMFYWAVTQKEDLYMSSSLCKSQVPLVHKNLMEDSTYNVVDGLKITRLAMRCLKSRMYRPSMHGIIKYLCKLRVVRENWDVLDCDNIIRDHLIMY